MTQSERRPPPPIPLDHAGLCGELHLPADDRAAPCVMVLGGSSGGLPPEAVARDLAAAGFAALRLAYFNRGSLPQRLLRIPLEYFARAAEWLVAECGPLSKRVVVLGNSRGAELALELASTYRVFEAAVLTSPSHVRWGAVGGGGAAWTLDGKDLPFVQSAPSTPRAEPVGETLDGVFYVASRHGYPALLHGDPSVRDAEIAVERLHGPLLMFSGEDDQLWPSDVFADRIEERARRHGFAHALLNVKYPGAGHVFPQPGEQPVVRVRFGSGPTGLQMGGEPAAIVRAAADRWTRTLAFLAGLAAR